MVIPVSLHPQATHILRRILPSQPKHLLRLPMKLTTRNQILTEALHMLAFTIDPIHADVLVKNAIIEAEDHLPRVAMRASVGVSMSVTINGKPEEL